MDVLHRKISQVLMVKALISHISLCICKLIQDNIELDEDIFFYSPRYETISSSLEIIDVGCDTSNEFYETSETRRLEF